MKIEIIKSAVLTNPKAEDLPNQIVNVPKNRTFVVIFICKFESSTKYMVGNTGFTFPKLIKIIGFAGSINEATKSAYRQIRSEISTREFVKTNYPYKKVTYELQAS